MADPKRDEKEEPEDQEESACDDFLGIEEIERRTAEMRVGDRICNHASRTPFAQKPSGKF